MDRIIVDTSALYALIDSSDPNHHRASAFLKQNTGNATFLLSNHVFDETMTLVKMRLGMHAAMQLGMRLRSSRFFEMVIFSELEEQVTWRTFTRYTDKEWSYTDCACLALGQRRGIDQAFSFDHHFVQMGLVVVP